MKPMPNNPRRISKKAAQRLQADLEALGDLGGIVHNVVDDTLCGGHQRLRVLFGEQAGEFKVTEADIEIVREFDAPDAQGTVAHGFILWRGFRYAYRRVAWDSGTMAAANVKANLDGGQWDWDALAGWDAEALQGWGFDADALAQWNDDAANLREMLTAETEEPPEDAVAQVDRAEELRELWGVDVGQVWSLGSHRLVCGDSSDTGIRSLVVGDDVFDTVVFDPEWDKMPEAIQAKNVLAFCDGGSLGCVVDRYGAPAWIFSWDCVTSWYTPNRPLRRMKLCAWYGDVSEYNFNGWHYGYAGEERDVRNSREAYHFKPDVRGKHLSDVFQYQITKEHSGNEHNHSKPLDWITLLIANCTTGVVYDPFCGSGTSIIACEKLGRKCISAEISPQYVAVILQRFNDFVGISPTLIRE